MSIRKWQRAVELANDDLMDDAVAVTLLVRFLDSFGVVADSNPPRVHPGLARAARQVQPQLRVLLRYIAGDIKKVKEAQEIFEEHRHHGWTEWPEQLVQRTMNRRGSIADFAADVTARQEEIQSLKKQGIEVRLLMQKRKQSVSAYRDALDPFCELAVETLKEAGTPPVRLCRLVSCRRFFVRGRGRRLFCPRRCKSKRWQMPRTSMRDYEYRRLAEQLSAKALRARIAAEPRKKSPLEKRRRHLRILRTVLREKAEG